MLIFECCGLALKRSSKGSCIENMVSNWCIHSVNGDWTIRALPSSMD
jgi:hypothetical protein